MGTPLFTGDVFQWARFCNVNGALPVLTPTFLFPASPALILYPEVVVFFLKGKDARGQAQGLVHRRKIEGNNRIAEIAVMGKCVILQLGFGLGFLLEFLRHD